MLKFNDSDLESIVYGIVSIETTLISSRENYSLDIPSRNGLIYNGYKYGEKKIEITLDIKEKTDFLYKEKRDAICDILDVAEPSALYIQEGRFYYAVVDGEIKEEKICRGFGRITITFVCFSPFAYNPKSKQCDMNNNIISMMNEGNVECYPLFGFSFNNECHFIQLENVQSGKKMLIGAYPSLNKEESVSISTRVLNDEMNSTSGWTTSTASIDTDRATGGTLGVTSTGDGLMCGSFGSTSTTDKWHGVCARKNLDSAVTAFEVNIKMTHDSVGTNGDPTVFDAEQSSNASGYYTVTSSTLTVRSGPGTTYEALGKLTKGHKIKSTTVINGWVKFTYNQKQEGYCNTKFCKQYISTTGTTTRENVVIVVGENSSAMYLRAYHSHTSKVVTEIPLGAKVRIISSTKYKNVVKDENKEEHTYYYYKLAEPYLGKYDGYVCAANIAFSENVIIDKEYGSDATVADDKTGVLEVYGFSANSVRIFKCMLCDANSYYEHTYPSISIGSEVVLEDQSQEPSPRHKNVYSVSGSTITQGEKTYLSGQYGNWNEFFGNFKVKRDGNNTWTVQVQKIKDGTVIKTLEKTVQGNYPTDDLSYLVIYIGTSGDAVKSCAMSINNITVDNLNTTINEETQNIKNFKQGDTLIVDCYNNRVLLNNNNALSLVDVGSDFFALEPGNADIKITTDDKGLVGTSLFNEKYL